jgi:putative flippase GtrA
VNSLRSSISRLHRIFRQTPRELGCFGLIGMAGFAVDCGLLTLLVECAGAGPIVARFASFPAAILVTWSLNRRFTFRHLSAGRPASMQECMRYAVVQCSGALTNVIIYAALVAIWPAMGRLPALPLAIAALLAMITNYLGARALVFASRNPRPAAAGEEGIQ